MIRHAFFGGGLRRSPGPALAVSALAVAMIEAAGFRLLIAAIGGAVLNPVGQLATGVAAIELSPLTGGTDEEDNPTTWRLAGALAERGVTVIKHVKSRSGWTAETEGGKMQCTYNLCFGNGASKV
jgi:hypothetical protein